MEDLTGRQFGRYQIVAPLGEGGMAAVYQAYQPAMDRQVALKVLPRHFSNDPQFTGRFEREAKLVAQLQHPHILPVFDYGQADGYSYIVMPFVRSGTLAGLLAGHPLALTRIRQAITQIGEALGYAHARGLIHRDVKPSNVLIDESGNCLLTDFGLARMAEASVRLTLSGSVLGTPAYMSPEQGLGRKVDLRTDLYSLGVILYEMATGRVPYNAETPLAVILKHVQDPLPPARAVNPDLPERVERVILKALSKTPEDRFQTAADFVRALQAAIPDREGPSPEIPQLDGRSPQFPRLDRHSPQILEPPPAVLPGPVAVPRGRGAGPQAKTVDEAVPRIRPTVRWVILGLLGLAVAGGLYAALAGGGFFAAPGAELSQPAPLGGGQADSAPTALPAGGTEAALASTAGGTEAAAGGTALSPSGAEARGLPPPLQPLECPNPRVHTFAIGDDHAFETGSADWAEWGAVSGEYRFLMKQTNSWGWKSEGIQEGDALFAVDVRRAAAGSGAYGLVFGANSLDNGQQFYAFLINPAGYWGLYRHTESGDWIELNPFTFSPLLRSGDGTNHLSIVRSGPLIAVFANGLPLAGSFSDAAFTGAGYAGLIAWSNETSGLEARFDNYSVCALTAPYPMPVYPFGHQTMRWPADQPVALNASWLARTRDLAQAYADLAVTTLIVDGQHFTGLGEYWEAPAPYASGYAVQLSLPLPELAAGTHLVETSVSLPEQLTDGFDEDNDGQPDAYGPGEVFSGWVELIISE